MALSDTDLKKLIEDLLNEVNELFVGDEQKNT